MAVTSETNLGLASDGLDRNPFGPFGGKTAERLTGN